MKSRNFIQISLTGGLGNQLFQYAFALANSRGKTIELVTRLAAPRSNAAGSPDLIDFDLAGRDVVVSSRKFSKFATKAAGYLLRLGVEPRGIENIRLVQAVLRFAGGFALSLDSRKKLRLFIGNGVGYFNHTYLRNRTLVIGYFQSFRWAASEEVFHELMRFKPKNTSHEYRELASVAMQTNFISVHCRRGDYLKESKFGVLDFAYFQNAFAVLPSTDVNREVWLFSDDSDYAKNMISRIFPGVIRVIPNSLNPAETLQLMRYGSCFVISNSTFSWWGAFLRFDSNAKVISPNPWFTQLNDPLELIPPEWIAINRD